MKKHREQQAQQRNQQTLTQRRKVDDFNAYFVPTDTMKNMKRMKVLQDNVFDIVLQQDQQPSWRNIRRRLRGNPLRFKR